MFSGKRIAVVVPAYNESRLIGRTVEAIPRYVDFAVVVDDGSTDGTGEVLRRDARPLVPVHCIRHESNRGVGAAIASGYREAMIRGADVVVVMGGDAQMDAADMGKLIAPIVEGRADYVKGERTSDPDVRRVMPLARWLGIHVLTWLTRRASGYEELLDSQCGYTAVNARALHLIDLDRLYPRYGYPNDLLVRMAVSGARLAQVPVRPVYGDEVSGLSWFTGALVVPWVVLCAWGFKIRATKTRDFRRLLLRSRGRG